MKPYALLGTHERNQPCLEYPGTWLVFVDGNDGRGYNTLYEAAEKARELAEQNPDSKIQIGWECSNNDPRVGQVWFTGFYILTSI